MLLASGEEKTSGGETKKTRKKSHAPSVGCVSTAHSNIQKAIHSTRISNRGQQRTPRNAVIKSKLLIKIGKRRLVKDPKSPPFLICQSLSQEKKGIEKKQMLCLIQAGF